MKEITLNKIIDNKIDLVEGKGIDAYCLKSLKELFEEIKSLAKSNRSQNILNIKSKLRKSASLQAFKPKTEIIEEPTPRFINDNNDHN